METTDKTKDLELLVKELQSENEKLKTELESYKKWYYEKLATVNEQKEFIVHIKGLIAIYTK